MMAPTLPPSSYAIRIILLHFSFTLHLSLSKQNKTKLKKEGKLLYYISENLLEIGGWDPFLPSQVQTEKLFYLICFPSLSF